MVQPNTFIYSRKPAEGHGVLILGFSSSFLLVYIEKDIFVLEKLLHKILHDEESNKSSPTRASPTTSPYFAHLYGICI